MTYYYLIHIETVFRTFSVHSWLKKQKNFSKLRLEWNFLNLIGNAH